VPTLGKYRLLERLASGGMADVWRAEVVNAEAVVKEVALKLVRGDHAAQDAFIRMFIQEARLASRLSHANVVQVFEFHQIDGQYVIAMELVRGRHLGQVVERCRELGLRFGLPRALHVCAEVAKGLAYAHRLADGARPLGIVHRDVSPHNVLVSFEGEVKLADFGIARARNLAGLTEPGTLKGKLPYMAPEQARTESVDARADVFSLGVILWELLAGRRLFARESEAATLAAVLGPEPLSPPSAWNESVSPELDAAVLAALERDPARRTASAQELASALGGVLLRTARSPEEFDLRALMHRLWPEDAAGLPPPTAEPTRVRTPSPPVSLACEGGAAPEPTGPDGSAAKPAARAAAVVPREERSETATRTAVAPRPGRPERRRRRVIAAGVAVAAAVAVASAIGLRAAGVFDGAAPASPSATREPLAIAAQLAPASAVAAPPAAPASAATGAPAAPSTPTSTAVAGSAPASLPTERPGRGKAAAVRRARCVNQFIGVDVPSVVSGDGLLSMAVPAWAELFLDGRSIGFTPCTVRLPAGTYRLRAENPKVGRAQLRIAIEPGKRSVWKPTLSR
jgi:serine/threonine protein kinase